MSDDYYNLLGVPRTATQKDIAAGYRRQVKMCHPDLYPGNAEKKELFIAITEAYGVLGDTLKRLQYDERTLPTTVKIGVTTAPREPDEFELSDKTWEPIKKKAQRREDSLKDKLSLTIARSLSSPLTLCIILGLAMLLALQSAVNKVPPPSTLVTPPSLPSPYVTPETPKPADTNPTSER